MAENSTTLDRSSFIHAAEAFMATCAPDVEFDSADLFGFISAAWPYSGAPEDAASEFAEAIMLQRESAE